MCYLTVFFFYYNVYVGFSFWCMIFHSSYMGNPGSGLRLLLLLKYPSSYPRHGLGIFPLCLFPSGLNDLFLDGDGGLYLLTLSSDGDLLLLLLPLLLLSLL